MNRARENRPRFYGLSGPVTAFSTPVERVSASPRQCRRVRQRAAEPAGSRRCARSRRCCCWHRECCIGGSTSGSVRARASTTMIPTNGESVARNCLPARPLAERGVRFIELVHRGWHQYTQLPRGIRSRWNDVDQPQAALIQDLREPGLLDDTLLVWGGEFGRSVCCQGKVTAETYGTRSPPAMLHDLDGRRGCQERPHARRDRRYSPTTP
jgi:hypothetical protein